MNPNHPLAASASASSTASYEPSGKARLFAKQMRDNYLALVKEGFTEAQAMHLIGLAMSAALQKPSE